MTKNKRGRNYKVLTAEESGAWLKSILAPVLVDLINMAALDRLAVVFHNPTDLTFAVAKTFGLEIHEKETTVYGALPAEFAKRFEHDPATQRWCSTGPGEDEIKVFLFSGWGSLLLTLSLEDDHVAIKREPDVYPVPQDGGAFQ